MNGYLPFVPIKIVSESKSLQTYMYMYVVIQFKSVLLPPNKSDIAYRRLDELVQMCEYGLN